jgi:hypothetical protein
MQLQCIPSALGWVLIASAQSVPALYAGRFLTGLGGGMVDATCQVYVKFILLYILICITICMHSSIFIIIKFLMIHRFI